MTQNTKKILIYGGAIIVGSGIAYAIYKANKTKLPLVDGAKVTDDEETTVPEGTTPPKSTRANYFSSLLQNPFPKDIDYTFGSSTKL
jgi:pantothenate kinase type III